MLQKSIRKADANLRKKQALDSFRVLFKTNFFNLIGTLGNYSPLDCLLA